MARGAGRTPRSPIGRTIGFHAVTFLLLCFQTVAHAVLAQEHALEHEVKATFLYKFGSYIEWPEGTFDREDEPLTIGVIGADDVAQDLREIVRDKSVNGRPILVRVLGPSDPPQQAQILFIGRAAPASLASVLSSTNGRPVVTVTELEGRSAEGGGMINFVTDDNKVRFDVLLAKADSNNIKISARLLRVARKVIAGSEP